MLCNSSTMRFWIWSLHIFLIIFLTVPLLIAEEKPAQVAQDLKVVQKLGDKLDLSRVFTDQRGDTKQLKEILDPEKPTIVVPAYYNCPRLCSLVLNGVRDISMELGLTLRSDYRIVTISFDPKETHELAASKYSNYMKSMALSGDLALDHGWDFLVGEPDQVSGIMNKIGYPYRSDGKKDFSHGAAIVIISPDGVISRYLFGIEFKEKDLRLALVEASDGQIGSVVDQVMLFCFRFDPTKGKYTPQVFAFMKIFGAITLLFMLPFLFTLWRKHR